MDEYLKPLIETYHQNCNSEQAAAMSRYMQDLFPFLGIKTPLRRQLLKQFLQEYGIPSSEFLPELVQQLWELPEREFQYTALSLLRKAVNELPRKSISLYEELLTKKSWWDTVDGIASWLVGNHFKNFPESRDFYIDKWLTSGNIWLKRTCLIFQLDYKHETNQQILFRLIDALKDSPEFFIRKAIGWSLRQYSKVDAKAVIDFVNNTDLSPLSHREALKWLNNQKKDS